MASQFQQFGHKGNLKSAKLINAGTTFECTGSEYGVNAVIKNGSYNGIINLADGGFVSGSDLTSGVIYNFLVYSVSGGSAGSIYLFKTQGI
jgi:hypothetical protein